jgi:hypothetical protein
MTEFIGKKITGIKFPTSKKVFFHGEMTQYIGRQGTIIDYNEELDSFKVAYADGKTFSYPVEKVFNELFF